MESAGLSTLSDSPIRLVLIDDHTLVREGLREILHLRDHLAVVGGAGTALEGVAQAARHLPDIVLLDGDLPDGEATETVRQLRAVAPDARIVAALGFDGPQPVRAGARGAGTRRVGTDQQADSPQAGHYRGNGETASAERVRPARSRLADRCGEQGGYCLADHVVRTRGSAVRYRRPPARERYQPYPVRVRVPPGTEGPA